MPMLVGKIFPPALNVATRFDLEHQLSFGPDGVNYVGPGGAQYVGPGGANRKLPVKLSIGLHDAWVFPEYFQFVLTAIENSEEYADTLERSAAAARGVVSASSRSSPPPFVPLEIARVRNHFAQFATGLMRLSRDASGDLRSTVVTHRDIKPENMLFTKGGSERITLIDFGLSLVASPSKKFDEAAGTPYYIAPEVLDIAGVGYTYKIDIWCAGIVLFQMLTATVPFRGFNTMSIFQKIKYNTPAWPASQTINSQAKELVNKMLNKDPARRPDWPEILNSPFLTGLSDEEYSALGVPRAIRQGKWAKLREETTAAGGAAAGAAAGGLGGQRRAAAGGKERIGIWDGMMVGLK